MWLLYFTRAKTVSHYAARPACCCRRNCRVKCHGTRWNDSFKRRNNFWWTECVYICIYIYVYLYVCECIATHTHIYRLVVCCRHHHHHHQTQVCRCQFSVPIILFCGSWAAACLASLRDETPNYKLVCKPVKYTHIYIHIRCIIHIIYYMLYIICSQLYISYVPHRS